MAWMAPIAISDDRQPARHQGDDRSGQVFLTPNPDYKGMQPDAMKRMTDAFRMEFVGALASGYQVVNQPGPDVLRVRIAITGVQPTSPALGVTDFIPIKALFSVAGCFRQRAAGGGNVGRGRGAESRRTRGWRRRCRRARLTRPCRRVKALRGPICSRSPPHGAQGMRQNLDRMRSPAGQ